MPNVANMARHAFQSSKFKLNDSDMLSQENTNGTKLLRSKQGINRGLHVSLKSTTILLPLFFGTLASTPFPCSLRRISNIEVVDIFGGVERLTEAHFSRGGSGNSYHESLIKRCRVDRVRFSVRSNSRFRIVRDTFFTRRSPISYNSLLRLPRLAAKVALPHSATATAAAAGKR
ncbi:hypothetical protein E2542_SST20586 [Spatholobus suberectus]|nr:hypothetical protein E2542_SST20586 [Spatholobus suberectus]